MLVEKTITLGVQINGKMRGTIETEVDATEEEVRKLVENNSKFQVRLPKKVERVVYVPGRIINIIGKES